MKKILKASETRVASMPTRTAILIVVAAAAVLTGCAGGGPSKRQMANAINEAIKQKVSFTTQDNWPLRVMPGTLDPILSDMIAAGYLKLTQDQHQGLFNMTVDVITRTGQAKKWWSAKDGFCVGTMAVADVQEWTVPNQSGSPVQEMQVKYTWHLIDVPSWAKRPEFSNIPGMTKPVADTIILQKTNKGWEAVNAFGGLE